MMNARMFGQETELAFHAYAAPGRQLHRQDAVVRLMTMAKQKLPHVQEGRHALGMFLYSGGRFYVDNGQHVELTTPECTTPADCVRYIVAGDRLLAELAQEFVESSPDVREAFFYKCNVDYSGARTTWGCHESFLHTADKGVVAQQLIPHLVSRIIYAGAGGFNNRSPGIEFVLSPRMPHMTNAVSPHSTHDRGIFHTKDEPLCKPGYHRLHILCGESLCSHLGMWLKLGTTALVLALVENGVRFPAASLIRNPLHALRVFAKDSRCTAAVVNGDENAISALHLQRAYLDVVEENMSRHFMPSWATPVCVWWRRVLDMIENDPQSLATTLDWLIKYALYTDYLEGRGYTWERIHAMNAIVTAHDAHAPELSGKMMGNPRIVEQDNTQELIRPFREFVERHGGAWDVFLDFWKLRQELFEIDTRFAMLGAKGIFNALDADGVLNHSAPGVNQIERAMTDPPDTGRARARGNLIKEIHARGESPLHVCGWEYLINVQDGKRADLIDPFQAEASWTDADVGGAPKSSAFDLPGLLRRRGRRSSEMDIPF